MADHNYNVEFIQALDTKLRCQLCYLGLRSPFQTECGHRYCESCIKDVINNGDQKCPLDKHKLSLQRIFKDNFCEREILRLHCYCTNKNLGCAWTGKLHVLENHLKDCHIKLPQHGVPFPSYVAEKL